MVMSYYSPHKVLQGSQLAILKKMYTAVFSYETHFMKKCFVVALYEVQVQLKVCNAF